MRTKAIISAILLLATTGVGCKARKDQAGSDALGSIERSTGVPEIGYHFGEYRYLSGYGDRDGTFNVTEWNSIPSTRYEAGSEGFYFAQHPAYNEVYGQGAFQAQDPSWMVEIKIAPSCRDSGRVLWTRERVEDDPRFAGSRAVKSEFQSAADFVAQCRTTKRPDDLVRRCNRVTTSFMNEVQIKIIRDTLWANYGYWIVRDPRCITSIKASPASALRMLGEIPELWNSKPFQDDTKRRTDQTAGSSTIMILVKALDLTPAWSAATLKKIRDNVQDSDMPGAKAAVEAIVDAASSCSQKGAEAPLRKSFEQFIGTITAEDALWIKKGGRPFESWLSDWLYQMRQLNCVSGAVPGVVDASGLKVLKRWVWPKTSVEQRCTSSLTRAECDQAKAAIGARMEAGTQADYATVAIEFGRYAESTSRSINLKINEPEESLQALATRRDLTAKGLLGLFVPGKNSNVDVECMRKSVISDAFSFTPEQCSDAVGRLDRALAEWGRDPGWLYVYSLKFDARRNISNLDGQFAVPIESTVEQLKGALEERAAYMQKPFTKGSYQGVYLRCGLFLEQDECNATVERIYNVLVANPDLVPRLKGLSLSASSETKVGGSPIKIGTNESEADVLRILRGPLK